MKAIGWRTTELSLAGLRVRLRWPPASVAISAVVWSVCVAAWACDTPVYRYAMYRWTPMSYEAFYFHRGQVPKADRELHQSLFDSAQGRAPANMTLKAVDLDRKDALDALPEPVKKRWQSEASKPLPRYLILSPWGVEVFAGPIDAATARQLAESPLRAEIGSAFDQGHGIVLLILGGDQPEANARMESAARAVIAKASSGDLFSEAEAGTASAGSTSPSDSASAGSPEDNQNDPRRSAIRIALLKLDRGSSTEAWLLRMLAAMSPGASKTPEGKTPREPMLYPIYGRGRVMPPGIGKEVTAESLTELLRFLADRCSCTIKDQNPGLDLLMQWDWETTAEKFLASDPTMAPQPPYAEVAADGSPAVMGSDGAPALTRSPSSATGSAIPPSPSPLPGGKSSPQPTPSQVDGLPQESLASPAAIPGVPVTVGGTSPSAAEEMADSHEVVQTDFAARQRWQLGIGLAGVAALVIAIGLALVRRQQP